MRLFGLFFIFAAFSGAVSLHAEGRSTLGWGALVNNDAFGDGHDRWQTASFAVSKVRGLAWTGTLPERAGEIVEYRFRGGIAAPANLMAPAPGDRPYAAGLSFGAHTHFRRQGTEISLGADLVITGPQTGLAELQREVHSLLGRPFPATLGPQIADGVHPTMTLELGRKFAFSDTVALRPFAEMQAGVETLLRVGGDLHLGRAANDALLLRDAVTGQRYVGVRGEMRGFAAVLGADIAHVWHSTYLPASGGYTLTNARSRLRAGLHWQGEASSVFYGVSWLGKEFTAQPEGQVVGSVRLDIRF